MSDEDLKPTSPPKPGKKNPWLSLPRSVHLKIVENFIDSHKVAIFSKTWCPWCTKAKNLLSQRQIDYDALELDEDENGASLQAALTHLSDRKTVPNIYVNGKSVGGYTELASLIEAGVFEDLMSGLSIEFDYDLIVIGGGSGGLSLAKEAAVLKQKVALCDYVVPSPLGTKWGLGGTCVNVGCIPKKLMHRASIIRQDINDAADFGWKLGLPVHDWDEMVHRIQNHVKSLNFNYRKSLMELGVKYFNHRGTFIDKHTVELKNDKETIKATAKNIVIATGGRPKYPGIPGDKQLCITSDDLFSMRTRPGRTLIVGGSYVALECAGFLVGLGYDVTVMVRSIVLRGFDRQMASKLENSLTSHGVRFVKNCVPISFDKDDNGAVIVSGDNQGKPYSGRFDTVLLAIGRQPCTDNMNLERIGVQIDPKSYKILTDSKERTTVSNIFAIGDVAEGKPELTPVAIQAGYLLAQRLYNVTAQIMDYNNVPTTIFTPIEYGCVGLTEEQALENFGLTQIEVYHQEFQYLESVLNTHSKYHPKGYAKLIVVRDGINEIVVGAHILAPNAGEIIQGYALAIKLKATKHQLDELVGIHPTTAEIFTKLAITKSSGKNAELTGC